jgi:hypothetical protein
MIMDPVERIEVLLVWTGVSQEANASDPAELLRTRGERPRGRAADKRDEVAPSELIELHSVPCQPEPAA